jgi:hypothetical protein
VETYRYENYRETKEMDCKSRRRYANNGNKTVEKGMQRKSRMEEKH